MTLVSTLLQGTIAQEVAANYPLQGTIPLLIGRTIEVRQRDFTKKVLLRRMVAMMTQRRIDLTSKRVHGQARFGHDWNRVLWRKYPF